MLKRLRRAFSGSSDFRTGTKIVLNCEKLEHRIALLEDGVLEEYNVERTGDEKVVGSVFKGKVKNIEPGLKAMFVDIGIEKNAFLHFWDAIPAALDGGMEEITRKSRSRKSRKKITSKDIPDIYPVGSEVMVQVTKGSIGNKGPRVTTNISLPGRFMVLMPLNDQFGISRKIEDPAERKRLRRIMEKLTVPDTMGLILRTVAAGKRARYFVRDLHLLLEQWDEIEEIRANHDAPVKVFEEPGLIERTVRDFLTDEVDEVLCDDLEQVEHMKELASQISRRSRKRIRHVTSSEPVFQRYGIQRQIDDAFFRQVWLKCGGYIVIDETEAMIAIDVNTGRNRGSKNVEKMILETNVEAAQEVARQLRLRNIGGLVVVDFIDMKGRRDQQLVYKAMRDRLRHDKAKTQVMQISQLGLMEMTRQRLNESLTQSMYEPCSYCEGRGKIKSTETMSVELQRSLHAVLQKYPDSEHDLLIIVNQEVMHRLRTEDDQLLVELERKHRGRLTFRSDPTYHREQVLISNAVTGEEIK
jgi:ribonuclease G